MVKAQKYLDENYPKEERSKLEQLELYGQNLQKHLDLSDFPNLKFLWVSNNQITSLDLSENNKLEKIFLSGNKITANLDVFSHTTTIKYLFLSHDNSFGQAMANNDFVGSLKSLKNNQWLAELNIDYNEKITEGLEYLPNEIETFSCKGTAFEEILKLYNNDILAWKLVNHPTRVAKNLKDLLERLDNKISEIRFRGGELLKLLTEYKEKTVQALSHKMVEKVIKENEELKDKVEELESRLEKLKLETKIEILPKS